MDFPIYQVHVRRDAMTTTNTAVPKHEVEILQEVFGLENVHNAKYERIDVVGLGEPVGVFVQEGDEMARLAGKYGDELVAKIFPNKKSLEAAFEKPKASSRTKA